MRVMTTYVAEDGKSFDTRQACEAHEASGFACQFVGLKLEQIQAALDRTNTRLADAFEVIGGRIADTRRNSGVMRRKSKGAADGATQTPADSETSATVATSTTDGPGSPRAEVVRSPAFERGRQAFLAGKPEMIPGGLPERDWDDWTEGYGFGSRDGKAA